jgi:hypothetical protein
LPISSFQLSLSVLRFSWCGKQADLGFSRKSGGFSGGIIADRDFFQDTCKARSKFRLLGAKGDLRLKAGLRMDFVSAPGFTPVEGIFSNLNIFIPHQPAEFQKKICRGRILSPYSRFAKGLGNK